MDSEDRVPTQTETDEDAGRPGDERWSPRVIDSLDLCAGALCEGQRINRTRQGGGIYATHLRSEGGTEMAAIDEALGIGREAGLPVEIFHLKVSEYYADLAIFDPATISDQATYTNPTLLSQGVDYVFVNGQLEYDHSSSTGVKAGRPLRGAGWEGTTAQ